MILVRPRHDEVSLRLSGLKSEKAQLASSLQHQYQCEQLLKEDWKSMRGVPWEKFLARVCSALGCRVETTRTSGDQGVDLVTEKGDARCAIQAKGYAKSVGSSAVQQAVAGMKIYRCNCCAVITNSTFTPSALELAKANACILIDEQNVRAFVQGKIPLD